VPQAPYRWFYHGAPFILRRKEEKEEEGEGGRRIGKRVREKEKE
jgi:hypothetical protein